MTAKATRSASRAALADAIEQKQAAARELSATEDAKSAASRRAYEATERLEAHRRAAAEPSTSDDMARSFIAAHAAGEECDVATLTRSDADRETEIQNEIDVWRKTKDACAKVVADRERDLQSAEFHLNSVARRVISEAFRPDVIAETRRLLARLEELRAELISIDLLGDSLSNLEDLKAAASTARYMRLANDGDSTLRHAWDAFAERLKANADEPFPLIPLEG